MHSFIRRPDETWVCELADTSGNKRYIVWNNTKEIQLPVKDFSAAWAKSIFGETAEIKNRSEIPIGPLPVLLSARQFEPGI